MKLSRAHRPLQQEVNDLCKALMLNRFILLILSLELLAPLMLFPLLFPFLSFPKQNRNKASEEFRALPKAIVLPAAARKCAASGFGADAGLLHGAD